MEVLKEGSLITELVDPCCGGAYDYDNDSNCVDDQ